jgi:hypothetical protein
VQVTGLAGVSIERLEFSGTSGTGQSNPARPMVDDIAVIPVAVALQSQTLGASRKNYTGYVVYSFTTAAARPLTVNSLGLWVKSGNTAAHTVELVDAATHTVIASTSLNTAGATSGRYLYKTLAAPVTLQGGHTYYLLVQQTSGGDSWYNDDTVVNPAGDLTVNGSILSADNTQFTAGSGGSNHAYGPGTFTYV